MKLCKTVCFCVSCIGWLVDGVVVRFGVDHKGNTLYLPHVTSDASTQDVRDAILSQLIIDVSNVGGTPALQATIRFKPGCGCSRKKVSYPCHECVELCGHLGCDGSCDRAKTKRGCGCSFKVMPSHLCDEVCQQMNGCDGSCCDEVPALLLRHRGSAWERRPDGLLDMNLTDSKIG